MSTTQTGTKKGNNVFGDVNFNNDALYISSSGNVGIGTTTPSEKLTIQGNISASGDLYIDGGIYDNNNSLGTSGQLLSSTGTGIDWVDVTEIGGVDGTGSTNYITRWVDGNTITTSSIYESGGNIGIGTTSPSEKLEVAGDIAITDAIGALNFIYSSTPTRVARLDSDNGNLRIKADINSSQANSFISFELDGNEKARIDSTGNVGIGTTTPSEALTVQGNISASGDLYLNNTLLSNQENTDVDTGTETVATVAIADYDAAFFDYVIKNSTNLRAGTVYAVHDGTNVEYTETSTQDLGDTTDVTLSVDISGADLRLLATTTSDNWIIKSLIRAI